MCDSSATAHQVRRPASSGFPLRDEDEATTPIPKRRNMSSGPPPQTKAEADGEHGGGGWGCEEYDGGDKDSDRRILPLSTAREEPPDPTTFVLPRDLQDPRSVIRRAPHMERIHHWVLRSARVFKNERVVKNEEDKKQLIPLYFKGLRKPYEDVPREFERIRGPVLVRTRAFPACS